MRILPILLGMLFISQSCKKDDIPGNPERGVSYFKVVHASASAPAFDAHLEYYNVKTPIGDALHFGEANPFDGYVKVTSSDAPSALGNGTLSIYGTVSGDTTLNTPKSVFSFIKDQTKTLWLVDSAGSKVWYESVDNFHIDSTHTQVRFANWQTGADFKLTANGYDSGLLNFAQVSNFITLSPGKYKFSLLDASGTEIATTDSLQLSIKSGYSFFVSGNQLKYIK